MPLVNRYCRMFKKIVRQGRSERRGEEVHTKLRLTRSLQSKASGEVLCLRGLLSVESLSDARTQPTGFFNILFVLCRTSR